MKAHRILAGIAIAALLAGPSIAEQNSAADWIRDPASKCSFVVPRSLSGGPVFWKGACPGGKASGLGVLRRRDGGRPGDAFYGEMRGGVPHIGVIDTDGGYRVGAFIDGEIGVGDLEWQTRIDSFNAAARAARAVSAKYATEGNMASARHYEAVAKTLEMQNDG